MTNRRRWSLIWVSVIDFQATGCSLHIRKLIENETGYIFVKSFGFPQKESISFQIRLFSIPNEKKAIIIVFAYVESSAKSKSVRLNATADRRAVPSPGHAVGAFLASANKSTRVFREYKNLSTFLTARLSNGFAKNRRLKDGWFCVRFSGRFREDLRREKINNLVEMEWFEVRKIGSIKNSF